MATEDHMVAIASGQSREERRRTVLYWNFYAASHGATRRLSNSADSPAADRDNGRATPRVSGLLPSVPGHGQVAGCRCNCTALVRYP